MFIVIFYDLQRHGKGKLITSTKNHYDGEFQYNQMHGQGTMVYESKDVYKGGWKNGMVCLVLFVMAISMSHFLLSL